MNCVIFMTQFGLSGLCWGIRGLGFGFGCVFGCWRTDFGLWRTDYRIDRDGFWVGFWVSGCDSLGLRVEWLGFWARWVVLGHRVLGLVTGGVVRGLGGLIWG